MLETIQNVATFKVISILLISLVQVIFIRKIFYNSKSSTKFKDFSFTSNENNTINSHVNREVELNPFLQHKDEKERI